MYQASLLFLPSYHRHTFVLYILGFLVAAEPSLHPAHPLPPRESTWAGSLFPHDPQKPQQQQPQPPRQREPSRASDKSSASPAPRLVGADPPSAPPGRDQSRPSSVVPEKRQTPTPPLANGAGPSPAKEDPARKNVGKNTTKSNYGGKSKGNASNNNNNNQKPKLEETPLNNETSTPTSSSSSSSPFKLFVDNLHPGRAFGFSQLHSLLTSGGESAEDEDDKEEKEESGMKEEKKEEEVKAETDNGKEEAAEKRAEEEDGSAAAPENEQISTAALQPPTQQQRSQQQQQQPASSSASSRRPRQDSTKKEDDSSEKNASFSSQLKRRSGKLAHNGKVSSSDRGEVTTSSHLNNNTNSKRGSTPNNNANNSRNHNYHNRNGSETVNVLSHMRRDIGSFAAYFWASSKHNLRKINDVYLSKVVAGCRWFLHQLLILCLVIVVASFKVASFVVCWIKTFSVSGLKSFVGKDGGELE